MATVVADTEEFEVREGWEFEPHPWRRYGARIIDISLFSFVFFFAFGLLSAALFPALLPYALQPPLWFTILVEIPLSIVTSSICIAFCHAFWGSTLGKWIFRLRIEAADGRRLSLGAALLRECYLVPLGYAFGLPLLSLLTLAMGYNDLENDGETRWDRAVGARPVARIISGIGYAWLVVGAALAIGAKVLGMIGIMSGH